MEKKESIRVTNEQIAEAIQWMNEHDFAGQSHQMVETSWKERAVRLGRRFCQMVGILTVLVFILMISAMLAFISMWIICV